MAILLCAGAILLLAQPERRLAALANIERAIELAGFGLRQITVTGHRFADDNDIYAALDLDDVRTLLSFDARAAQARIEQLPWIERASVERVVPDGIDVRVVERQPFAVWRTGERDWLIGRSGRKLQAVPAGTMPQLLRVAGAGAADETAALSAMLSRFPEVAGQVEFAERVGARRWTLHLEGGTSAQLPATDAAGALALLARLLDARLEGVNDIDLRVPARVLVRQRPDGVRRKSSEARLQENWGANLSEARVTASPPPLVGGIAEHGGLGVPPPLTPPRKGEGNPVAAVEGEPFHPLRVGERRGRLSGTSISELVRGQTPRVQAWSFHLDVGGEGSDPRSTARMTGGTC